MMFELTGSYQIVMPLLVACGAAAAVVHGVLGGSIYTIGARRRGIVLGRSGPSLSDLSVAQALDSVGPIPAALTYDELLALVGPTEHAAFPVVDAEKPDVVRVLSVREARRALLNPEVDRAATAGALAHDAILVLPDDHLGAALQRLAEGGRAEAVVIDGEGRPIGVLTREGILEAWRRATLPG